MSDYGIQTLNMFKMYTRENTITHADGDTGNSAQHVGHFFALCKLAKLSDKNIMDNFGLNYDLCMEAHTVKPGIYRRSPDSSHWGNNPDNLSRDQWQALQLAFAIRKDKPRLLASFKALLSRGLTHQNKFEGTDGTKPPLPDISHPTHFSVIIRGMGFGNLLWPLLCVLDLSFLAGIILRKSTNDYDNMLAPQLLYANVVASTFISKLAMRFYVRTNFITCLEQYHSVERNGILPFPALFWYAFHVNKYLRD